MNDVTPLFSVSSQVIHGTKMGSELGFPTINLVYPESADFETGVYTCSVRHGGSLYQGVMHVGPRKTIDNVETFEVHMLDYKGDDIYGEEVRVNLLKKLREVEHFDSIEKLVAQIEKDVKEAKAYFKKHPIN